MDGKNMAKHRRNRMVLGVLAGLVLGLCACGRQVGETLEQQEETAQQSDTTATEQSQESVPEQTEPIKSTEQTEGTENEGGEEDWYQQMLETSVLSTGANGRLEKVLDRMKKGESISVALIGGSVTEGAGAKNFSESYADRFFAGLEEAYPKAQLTYLNAGLGGTGSALGMLRYQRDVLDVAGSQPDLVIIEFAVNDYGDPAGGRAYESLIRNILKADNDPAVILVFSVFKSKWNMQDDYIPVGEHYGLPMVSIKDAVKQPFADGLLTDAAFFADEYHPTSYGHQIMADCIGELISRVEEEDGTTRVAMLPDKSVKSMDFVDLHLLTAVNEQGFDMSPGSFSGTDTQVQAFGRSGKCSFPDNWMHTPESGSEGFRVELTCKNILLNYKTSGSQDYGRAIVYVDGVQVAELNGYSAGGWNNSNPVLVLDEKESGSHVLEIRMAEGDEKKKFTLLAIGYSNHEADGLVKVYEDNFPIGVALPNYVLRNVSTYEDVILNNFNSITCENEMKPDSILDGAASRQGLASGDTYTHAAVKFSNCQPAIDFAVEHGLKIRFHTLVWHSQTPKWFFTEDYTDGGKLVSRDVMLKRMENYIADVLTYFDETYPGLIYAVDVVNEAFDVGNGDENSVRMKDNLWYDTVGPDYYYQAFVFARKYAAGDMKLFYNDYGCADKADLIIRHLEKAKAEGLIDGIGMQSHLSIDDQIKYKFLFAVKKFCDAGYEVQSTELDIGVKSTSETAYMMQARKYKVFFQGMKELQEEGYPITGITVWGLNDGLSWRRNDYCLLYDKNMEPKKAYLGAMLDPDIPGVE